MGKMVDVIEKGALGAKGLAQETKNSVREILRGKKDDWRKGLRGRRDDVLRPTRRG